MDYYTITSIVALVLLIIFLFWFWYVSYYALPSSPFPDSKNACPDYWKLDVSGNCVINEIDNVGVKQLQNMPHESVIKKNNKAHAINFSDPGWNNPIGAYLNVQENCNLTAWASAHGILWDGVTNYAPCASSIQSSATAPARTTSRTTTGTTTRTTTGTTTRTTTGTTTRTT